MQTSLSFVGRSRRHLCICVAVVAISFTDAELPQPAELKIWEQFSGEKALAHVQQLVDFGPRPPGSEAIEKSRAYIDQQLKLSGWQVTEQAFTGETARGKIRFVNLIARFPGARGDIQKAPSFLLCS